MEIHIRLNFIAVFSFILMLMHH